nr:MAG TPA: hypothetical protein [Caudoviricetes sp.]
MNLLKSYMEICTTIYILYIYHNKTYSILEISKIA